MDIVVGNGLLNCGPSPTGSSQNVNQLLTQTASGTFVSATDLPCANGLCLATVGLALGDVNGDGQLDIFVQNGNDGSVNEILIQGPSGSFTASRLPGTSFCDNLSPVLGDVNGDGHLDILVPSNEGQLLIGSGTGTFQASNLPLSSPESVFAFALGDVNNDGRLDIVAGTTGLGANELLLQQSSGAFTVSSLPSATNTNPLTQHIELVDMTGDGLLDVIVGVRTANHQLLIGDGSGNFAAQTLDAPSTVNVNNAVLRSLAVGDITGDGLPDIVVGNGDTSVVVTPSYVLVPGRGATMVATDVTASGTVATLALALGDVNGDGWLDMVQGTSSGANRLLLGEASGNYSTAIDLTGGARRTRAVKMADMDGDGDLDIVIGNGGGDIDLTGASAAAFNQLLYGDGLGGFVATDLPGGAQDTFDIAIGDINGDGRPDIVVANGCNVDTPTVNYVNCVPNQMLITGSGTFTVTSLPSDIGGGSAVAIGDIDGDNRLDIVITGHTIDLRMSRIPNMPPPSPPADNGCVDASGAQEVAGRYYTSTGPLAVCAPPASGDPEILCTCFRRNQLWLQTAPMTFQHSPPHIPSMAGPAQCNCLAFNTCLVCDRGRAAAGAACGRAFRADEPPTRQLLTPSSIARSRAL